MNFSNLSSCAMLCALLLCQISFDKFQNSSNILSKKLFHVHIHIYSKHIKGERFFIFCLLIFHIFVNRRAKVTHYGQVWLTYPEWTLHTVILTMISFVIGHGQLGPCGYLGRGHFGGQNITKWTRSFFSRCPSKFWRPVCRYLQPLPAHFLLPKLSRRASFALFQGKGEQRIELRVVSESHTLCPALHYS